MDHGELSNHVSGQELARSFYTEVVQDLIDVAHSAALLGEGSEVLGYDDARSIDHSWGLRLQIFVTAGDVERVRSVVERGLPDRFRDYPVRFYRVYGELGREKKTVENQVEATTFARWLSSQVQIDGLSELTPAKWLTIPQQRLLQVTAGAVFRDDTNELEEIRRVLSWYPSDVWRWMMATQWHLIGNTQPFLGRTVEAFDPRGSSLVAFRLGRLIMELCFLQERRYWPYLKWFGTAFSRLNIAKTIGPMVDMILESPDYHAKEDNINQALMLLGTQHNSLVLTEEVTPVAHYFEVGPDKTTRPYSVINAGDFMKACLASITDERVRRIPRVGSIDQLTHADDFLISFTSWPQRLEELYRVDPLDETMSEQRGTA